MTETAFFTTLQNRGLVTVSGPDRRGFLQGLISNDINLLERQASVYACLLNPQGKFLHDFFITEKGDAIFLECEGGARTDELARRLSIYKLRAKVEIDYKSLVNIYAIFNQPLGYPDPRHPAMGYRSFEKPDMEEKPFEAWDRHRILLTVPDGSRDMTPEKSTLLECNIDRLNGVSFEKGCYIGQELTARMHYRGLAKKHLYTVNVPFTGDGELRSSCGDVGIALLKDEEARTLKIT